MIIHYKKYAKNLDSTSFILRSKEESINFDYSIDIYIWCESELIKLYLIPLHKIRSGPRPQHLIEGAVESYLSG